jgi:hypothetical protein
MIEFTKEEALDLLKSLFYLFSIKEKEVVCDDIERVIKMLNDKIKNGK